MAEFCLECLNKISKTNYSKKDCVISKKLYFCEECNQIKKVVVRIRKPFFALVSEYLGN